MKLNLLLLSCALILGLQNDLFAMKDLERLQIQEQKQKEKKQPKKKKTRKKGKKKAKPLPQVPEKKETKEEVEAQQEEEVEPTFMTKDYEWVRAQDSWIQYNKEGKETTLECLHWKQCNPIKAAKIRKKQDLKDEKGLTETCLLVRRSQLSRRKAQAEQYELLKKYGLKVTQFVVLAKAINDLTRLIDELTSEQDTPQYIKHEAAKPYSHKPEKQIAITCGEWIWDETERVALQEIKASRERKVNEFNSVSKSIDELEQGILEKNKFKKTADILTVIGLIKKLDEQQKAREAVAEKVKAEIQKFDVRPKTKTTSSSWWPRFFG